jgi:hypothetical protein
MASGRDRSTVEADAYRTTPRTVPKRPSGMPLGSERFGQRPIPSRHVALVDNISFALCAAIVGLSESARFVEEVVA